MTLHTRDWEKPLLALAHEAAWADRPEQRVVRYEQKLLEQAYAHTGAMTARHSRSFFLASQLLPAPKRRAARALYAFCRTTDDLVDNPGSNAGEELCEWWNRSLSTAPATRNPVAVAWADTRHRYQIPLKYAEQLIEGVALDLNTSRYGTFEELSNYCYGVASTVGLMSMHIIGYTTDEAIRYAVKLGVALQLTNILRDVAEDWARGRLYLPQDELDSFGVTEADIAAGRLSDNWRALMKFQIERARRLYREAWPGIALLAPEGRLAIAAAADFYRAILADIEAHDYDVFSRRAHLTGWGKLRRLPSLWWQIRQMRNSPGPVTPAGMSQPALLPSQYRGQVE
jgi:phytoene synthase